MASLLLSARHAAFNQSSFGAADEKGDQRE